MTGDEGAAMKMTALRRAMLVAVPLAVALVATSAALAEQPTVIDCTLRFQLSGWSASYERVDGTGIVACSDDTSLPVFVQARGAGLTTGKPKISAGTASSLEPARSPMSSARTRKARCMSRSRNRAR